MRTWVVITGAASGLGAATARELHARGYGVFLTDIQEIPLATLATELRTNAHYMVCNVRHAEQVATAFKAASELGAVTGLVHCAGMLYGERILNPQGIHSLEAFQKVIEVNLTGTFNVVRLAAQVMASNPPGEDAERGVMVLTSSIAAEDGQIGLAAYAASKGGVSAMILPLAREFGKLGIRVVGIAPGIFETPLMTSVSEERRKSLEQHMPFPRRFGQPGEFAKLVSHIFENRMLNGTVLRIDGALRMPPR
jgi:NAD(P)-dependent dehydrogenase (short-subunit alcohol dehydrogenase family)